MLCSSTRLYIIKNVIDFFLSTGIFDNKFPKELDDHTAGGIGA